MQDLSVRLAFRFSILLDCSIHDTFVRQLNPICYASFMQSYGVLAAASEKSQILDKRDFHLTDGLLEPSRSAGITSYELKTS